MKQPKPPEVAPPPKMPPMPPPPEIGSLEAEAKSAYMDRVIEMRRKGRASTILTGGLGATGKADVARKQLLGQ